MNFKTRYFSIVSIIGIVFVIAGMLGFTTSTSNSERIEDIRASGGVSVTAHIISIDSRVERVSSKDNKRSNHDDDITFTPTYEYSDINGEKYTIEGSSQTTSNSSPRFSIGDRAAVMYDPTDPNNSFIDTGSDSDGGVIMIYFPLLFSVVGSLLVIFDLIKSTKTRRSESK